MHAGTPTILCGLKTVTSFVVVNNDASFRMIMASHTA
jgi:UDP-N-acetylglucosamine transferase subunit ALG13